MEKLTYSSSPHVKSPMTTRRIMIDVVIALLPACIVGIVYFGWKALVTLLIADVAAVATEFVYGLCQRKSMAKIWKEFDFSSCVTGLLIGMNMYRDTPWYVTLLASVFAIAVVKMIFGGTGKNIVNPAIAGRIFVAISFGAALGGSMTVLPNVDALTGGAVTSGATPLTAALAGDASTLTALDLLLGTGVAGTIGETCKIALLLGGVYLVVRRVLNFRWPLVYMLTAGVFSMILHLAVTGTFDVSVLWTSVLSGGLVLGAVFMATDYVTSPATKLGNYIYFVALGLLTAGMRYACKSEVVSYCILIMNLFVPLIDKYIVRKPFGYEKPQKAKEEKQNG